MVGKTVTLLVGVKVLVVELLVTEELVVVVVMSVLVLVLVLVEVLGEVVKKSVENDTLWVMEVENSLESEMEVKPLSTLESHCPDGEKEQEGDRGGEKEQEGDPGGHDEGSLGSQLEVLPLNQLRSLTAGMGSSS